MNVHVVVADAYAVVTDVTPMCVLTLAMVSASVAPVRINQSHPWKTDNVTTLPKSTNHGTVHNKYMAAGNAQ